VNISPLGGVTSVRQAGARVLAVWVNHFRQVGVE
jgi:hypothetical protein